LNNILFISFSGPLPNTDGKRQRTNAILDALSSKYRVDFLIVDNLNEFQIASKAFQSRNINFLYFTTNRDSWVYKAKKKIGYSFIGDKGLNTFIKELNEKNQYSFVFSRYINPVSSIPNNLKIICDIDDDFFELYQSKKILENNLISKLILQIRYIINLRKYKYLISNLDLAFFVKNEKNKHCYNEILPNLPFQLLTNNNLDFTSCDSINLLFVGKLSYKPNIDGIKWFLQEIWPYLNENIKKIELTIVSSVPFYSEEMNSIIASYSNIQVLYNVDSIQEVYKKHSVVIAPVFQGGGSSIKIVESLMMGRPVITSEFGCRGFENAVDEGFIIPCITKFDYLNGINSIFTSNLEIEKFQNEIYLWSKNEYNLNEWRLNLLKSVKVIHEK
jgi:glycosyltransferase involved in cell wall biosynthesis